MALLFHVCIYRIGESGTFAQCKKSHAWSPLVFSLPRWTKYLRALIAASECDQFAVVSGTSQKNKCREAAHDPSSARRWCNLSHGSRPSSSHRGQEGPEGPSGPSTFLMRAVGRRGRAVANILLRAILRHISARRQRYWETLRRRRGSSRTTWG